MDRLERVERRATEMIKDDQKPDIWGEAERAGFVQPWEMKVEGKLTPCYSTWNSNSGYREDRDSIFTRDHMENIRNNGLKLLLGTFCLKQVEIFHSENNQPVE